MLLVFIDMKMVFILKIWMVVLEMDIMVLNISTKVMSYGFNILDRVVSMVIRLLLPTTAVAGPHGPA